MVRWAQAGAVLGPSGKRGYVHRQACAHASQNAEVWAFRTGTPRQRSACVTSFCEMLPEPSASNRLQATRLL